MKKFRLSGIVCGTITQSNERDAKIVEKKLNDVKDKLEPYYNKKDWRTYEIKTEPYGKLISYCKDHEIPYVSNAWLKYWELFNEFRLVKASTKAFFNAELPGSGIAAFEHYVKNFLEKGATATWVGSSYLGEGSLPDTYGFYENNPDKWVMGDNNRGDMTSLHDIEKTVDAVKTKIGLVDLYSSDAGLDVSSDWNAQEKLNWRLHVGCAYAGLLLLAPGGNCILKQYTYFLKESWYLIQLYASCFQSFYITKPLTSKTKNSEIYLVGLGFLGNSVAVVDALRKIRIVLREDKLSGETCDGMPDEIFESLKLFYYAQINYLSDYIKNYTTKEWEKSTNNESELLTVQWLTKYPVFKPPTSKNASYEGYKQGTYVFPFNSEFAFVTENDKLSDLDIPNDAIEIDERLSRVLMYLYLACYSGLEKRIVVSGDYLSLLKQLLPGHNFTDKREGEYVTVDEISLVNTIPTITYHGYLVKPIFVSRFTNFLYDLRESSSDPKTVKTDYCIASLNYFSNVIRNNTSGKGYCIWKDPIIGESKLRDSYDNMFAYYVVDRYLSVVNTTYPDPDPEFRLAKVLTVFDWISNLVSPKEKITTATLKVFDDNVVSYEAGDYKSVSTTNVSVKVNETLRNFTELFVYLAMLLELPKNSEATVVITGFRNYFHIPSIVKFFPSINFVIYGAVGKSKDNVTFNKETLTSSVASIYAGKEVSFVSGNKDNGIIISKMKPSSACIRHISSNVFLISAIFASCFVANNTDDRCFAVVQNANISKKPNYVQINNFLDNFAVKWRDINKFSYKDPIQEQKEDCYDMVFLAHCIKMFCDNNSISHSARELFSGVTQGQR